MGKVETEQTNENAIRATHDCLIAFGSNLGDRGEIFIQTLDRLAASAEIEVAAQSELVSTKPVGGPADQDTYLNAAIRLTTTLSATDLHRRLVDIETELGRVRQQRWGSRVVDLDLLLFDQEKIVTKRLTIPHPRMSFRRFVLEPAIEIAGDMVHPGSKMSIRELILHLDSTEKLILCVCPDSKSAKIGKDVEKSLTKELAWEFVPIRQISEIADYSNFKTINPSEPTNAQRTPKLVCYFASDLSDKDQTSELMKAAKTFRGPKLALRSNGDQAIVEINAAIQAMSKG